VIDLAAPAPGETVADVGCGNGAYLAELAPGHLSELREIVAVARGDGRWGGRRERLTLDDGEVLGPGRRPHHHHPHRLSHLPNLSARYRSLCTVRVA
jgi:hypothetical protein